MPDGRGIVYVFDRGIRRISLDGSSAMDTIVDNPDPDVPIVTPDGQFVVVPLSGSGRGVRKAVRGGPGSPSRNGLDEPAGGGP